MSGPRVSDEAVQTSHRCPDCGWILFREPGGWYDDEDYDPSYLICPQCGWDDSDVLL